MAKEKKVSKGKQTTAVAVKEEISVSNEKWYQSLVEDCVAIRVEMNKRLVIDVYQRNWEIGKRIMEDNNNMERSKIYGKGIIQNLAKDIGFSAPALFQFVQLYKNFPVEKGFKEFDDVEKEIPVDMPWGRYVREKLGERKDEAHPVSIPRTFKMSDIQDVLKAFLIDEIGLTNEKEIEDAVEQFSKRLIKYSKS